MARQTYVNKIPDVENNLREHVYDSMEDKTAMVRDLP